MKEIGITFGLLLFSLLTYSQTEFKEADEKEKVKVTIVSSSKLYTDSIIYVKKASVSNQKQPQAISTSKKIISNKKTISINSKQVGSIPEKSNAKKEDAHKLEEKN